MSSNGCWFGDISPFISTESTIRALEGQQSAVHCLSSKCGRNFPQNSLVLARFLLLQILFISLDLQIKTIFTGRFQGQAGPPQVHASTPFKGWVGSPPLLSLGYRFGYRFGYRKTHLVNSRNIPKIVPQTQNSMLWENKAGNKFPNTIVWISENVS